MERKVQEYILMTGIGGALTIIFGVAGHFIAKKPTIHRG
jgi:hypothetical protein